MIRHLFRLVWNRRRTNRLILVELLLCFVVLCGTLTMAGYYAVNWNKPLGFDYENLWRLDLAGSDGIDTSGRHQAREDLEIRLRCPRTAHHHRHRRLADHVGLIPRG